MLSQKDIDLYLVDITVHLDILGYSIVLPIMASLSIQLGGTVKHTSYLFSCYAITQFISYLYMGRLSDRYGRKPMLILSIIGSSIGAIAQGLASSIWALIIARAITGLFAGSWIVAQAYIADCTNTDERPKYMARLEAFLAAAYIFGPAIGGMLGEIRLNLPFLVAGGIAAVAFVFVLLYLHESLDKKRAEEKKKESKKKESNWRGMFSPIIVFCMIVEFCNRWIINGWDSYFNTYAEGEFQLSSFGFSILVTCLGCISCCLNGFIYPTIIFKWNIPIPYVSMFAGTFQIISHLVMGSATTLPGALFGSVLMEIGYDLSTPAPASIISSYSNPHYQGEILSYNMMAGQFAMIFSPLAMSSLSRIKSNIPFFVSACSGVLVISSMIFVLCTPGGKMAGRMSRAELEKLSDKKAKASDNEFDISSA